MTSKTLLGKRHARMIRRRGRYQARSVLWKESGLSRVRACGLHVSGKRDESGRVVASPPGTEHTVAIKVSETPTGRVAGFSGVQSCGSVWACPVCSEKIQASRQAEVETALTRARERGWIVGFHTFTVRHQAGARLDGVWSAVSKAWRAATSGSRSAWAEDREQYGVQGYLRLVEVTHGSNGWHVHVHALVFLDPAASLVASTRPTGTLGIADVAAIGARMGYRWRKALRGTRYAPSKKRGEDHQLVSNGRLASYFAKGEYQVAPTKTIGATASDVTGSHAKITKHGNVTPFGLLARLVETGDADDLDLWREWERVSKGKRQLLWSNGMRDALDLNPEQEDQEVVDAADLEGEPDVLIPGRSYVALARGGHLPAVLEAAESGPRRLRRLLARLGAIALDPDTADRVLGDDPPEPSPRAVLPA